MRWNFPEISPDRVESDPTQAEFFNNNDVDRNESLVREVCQNSLDAASKEVVEVRFSLIEDAIPTSSMKLYIAELRAHLEALGRDTEFLDKPAGYLRIEDFGTKGLTGVLDSKDEGNFGLFWRRYGKSEKGGSANGRWGLGKTVYPNSSRINTFFGLTKRSDDGLRCLLGQAMLGSHKIGNTRHDPYGTFSPSGAGVIQMPVTSSEDLNQFILTFGLERKDEPGLSIVVPYPHPELIAEKLKEAAIKHYFFPIIEGRLVITINNQVINSTSIRTVAEGLPGLPSEMNKLFDFSEKVKKASLAPDIVLPDYSAQKNGELSIDVFSEEELARLREQFDKSELISIQVPVKLTSILHGELESYVQLFLKNDPDLDRAHEYYIRGGIAVTGNRNSGKQPSLSIMLARDKAVCEFLGDAENPAHTQWTESSDRLGKNYLYPRITLRLIKRLLTDLLAILSKTTEKTDNSIFQDIFFIPKVDGGNNPGDKPPATPSDIESKAQPFRVSKNANGFTIKANPLCAVLPPEAKVRVAYDVRKGNPFKRHSPHDFDLRKSPIVINALNAKGIATNTGYIKVVNPKAGFEMNVTGFDVNRDLVLDIEITSAEEV